MRREVSLSFTIAWDPAKPLAAAERLAVADFLRRAEEVAGIRAVSLRGDFSSARLLLSEASPPTETLDDVKARAFAAALALSGGRVAPAARALGVHRVTVQRWRDARDARLAGQDGAAGAPE